MQAFVRRDRDGFQAVELIDPDILYGGDYPYFSSVVPGLVGVGIVPIGRSGGVASGGVEPGGVEPGGTTTGTGTSGVTAREPDEKAMV